MSNLLAMVQIGANLKFHYQNTELQVPIIGELLHH